MVDTVEIVGRPRVVSGPEEIQRKDGKGSFKKYQVVLDNGSILVTFSDNCFDAVNTRLDDELTFEVEDKGDGFPPKITKVSDTAGVLYEPAAGGGWGGKKDWVDTTPSQNARHALGSAVAYVGTVNGNLVFEKLPSNAEVLMQVSELAKGFLEVIEELTKDG